jgi:hypothetical protein
MWKEKRRIKNRRRKGEPGLVVHVSNPSTGRAEAGRSQVQGQPGLHSLKKPE